MLAGVHDSLRSQTQLRLDEGFLGFDSFQLQNDVQKGKPIRPIGVGRIDRSVPTPDTITNRSPKGDFNKSVASRFGIHPGGKPLLFVVKKNVSVLKNLLNWVIWAAPHIEKETGRPLVTGIPLLIIDDEADFASVDTKGKPIGEDGLPDKEHDPTQVNKLIRKLLNSFEKCAFVGYTATPFANAFIHEDSVTTECGIDLFPRSFILNLPAPSNYVGPRGSSDLMPIQKAKGKRFRVSRSSVRWTITLHGCLTVTRRITSPDRFPDLSAKRCGLSSCPPPSDWLGYRTSTIARCLSM